MTRIQDKFTTRGRAFVAAGLTLLVGGFLLGFVDITRIGVLLAVLPLLANVATRGEHDSLAVTRIVDPVRLVVDQSAVVEVVFENVSGQRTQLQLAEERVGRQLGDGPRFIVPPMEPGEIREVEYQIRPEVRGRHRLGPLTFRVRDPFGLATIAVSTPGATDVLVLPRVEVLGSGRLHGNGIGPDGAIPHMVALHGEDDAAVRTYHEGDDLRRIHWPATAHRSELMVRQEDRPARRQAVIVMDSRADGHQGSGPSGSFEWAVTAAASIAAHLSQSRFAVHLVSSETIADSDATETIDIDNVLTCLAVARLGGNPEFEQVLRWAQPLTSVGALLIAIVTDHDEEVLRRIVALRQPSSMGLMFLLDSTSFGRGVPGAPDQTRALAAVVAAAGWSTCVVGPGVSVTQAWDAVSAHTAISVGAEG